MIFTEAKLKGAFIVEPEKMEDDRGFLLGVGIAGIRSTRLRLGLAHHVISFSKQKGDLLGVPSLPYAETK
jgi:hypothetical protein